MKRGVTVIIPTNRGGAYLEAAVASVRAQTQPVQQILLVDDGSPEPGLSAVAAALGIDYVRQQPSGLSVARNHGAAVAAHEWIAFLDDDDVWHPERIAAQMAALGNAPEAVGSCTGGWYMDAEGEKFGVGWGAPAATAAQMISYVVPPPRITTLLINREAYEAAGGCRTSMEPAEDNDLVQRLLRIGAFASVDQQLVGYRRHRGNVTQRGLAGREANRRVLSALLVDARDDPAMTALLHQHRRAFRRYAAADNLGEFIAAVRDRNPGYAAQIGWWGLTRVPLQSVRAVTERARTRGSR